MDISAVSEPILFKQRGFCHLNCMFFQIWYSIFRYLTKNIPDEYLAFSIYVESLCNNFFRHQSLTSSPVLIGLEMRGNKFKQVIIIKAIASWFDKEITYLPIFNRSKNKVWFKKRNMKQKKCQPFSWWNLQNIEDNHYSQHSVVQGCVSECFGLPHLI